MGKFKLDRPSGKRVDVARRKAARSRFWIPRGFSSGPELPFGFKKRLGKRSKVGKSVTSAAPDRDPSVATLRRTYKSASKLVQVRTWAPAVELEVLRLADGAMLAAADDLPNVNHLSDEDFMKLILD